MNDYRDRFRFVGLGFYFGVLGEDFEICWFGVESDFGVGSVAEGFVAGASASAEGTEDFAVQVDKVRTVFGRLDFYGVHEQDGLSRFYLKRNTRE